MATTSIWRVNGWLGKVLIYIETRIRPKTLPPTRNRAWTASEAQGLSDVIEYAVQQKKTGRLRWTMRMCPSCSGLCPGELQPHHRPR